LALSHGLGREQALKARRAWFRSIPLCEE
jgi:hypothetical protein